MWNDKDKIDAEKTANARKGRRRTARRKGKDNRSQREKMEDSQVQLLR